MKKNNGQYLVSRPKHDCVIYLYEKEKWAKNEKLFKIEKRKQETFIKVLNMNNTGESKVCSKIIYSIIW